jgi:hypothetical protein
MIPNDNHNGNIMENILVIKHFLSRPRIGNDGDAEVEGFIKSCRGMKVRPGISDTGTSQTKTKLERQVLHSHIRRLRLL